MSSPIELYLQCVESLETIHNQIELEKKKLNIVGTDIKATNKNIKQLCISIFDLVFNSDFKYPALTDWFKITISKLCFRNEQVFHAQNTGCYFQTIVICDKLVYESPPHPPHMFLNGRPSVQPIVISIDNIQVSQSLIDLLLFKTDFAENHSYVNIIESNEYKHIELLYFRYRTNDIVDIYGELSHIDTDLDNLKHEVKKLNEVYLTTILDNFQYQLGTMKETYDQEIKELQQQNNQFKQILMENKLLPEPMPEYNYTDIAKRIKPFKRELIAITKWRKPIPLAVAIPVKSI